MNRRILATTAIAAMLASPAALAQTSGGETQPGADGDPVSEIEDRDGGGSGMNEGDAEAGTAETEPAPGDEDDPVADPSSTEGGGTGMNESAPDPEDEHDPELEDSVEEEG